MRGRRAAVRVGPQTYGTGRASVVPVPRSYGAGLGALFVCCSLVVLVLFNICRLGDAVVSGPRKTRLLRTCGRRSSLCNKNQREGMGAHGFDSQRSKR